MAWLFLRHEGHYKDRDPDNDMRKPCCSRCHSPPSQGVKLREYSQASAERSVDAQRVNDRLGGCDQRLGSIAFQLPLHFALESPELIQRGVFLTVP